MSILSFGTNVKRWAPALVLGSIPFISACSDDDDDSVASNVATQNIVEIASNPDGDFTILAQAVAAADLVGLLSGTDEYTVFAPTDAAFQALLDADPSDALATPNDLLNLPNLGDILAYHVLPGTVVAADAISTAQSDMPMVDTLLGGGSPVPVSLSISNEMGVDSLYVNLSKVITPNVLATNGVIHAVNKVIMPPSPTDLSTESIQDIAGATGDLSELVGAINAAGLIGVLDNETVSNDPLSPPFTVFAPVNSAFADLLTATGNANLGELLANYFGGDTDALADVIKQHVVQGVEIESLAAFAANGASVPTLLSGKSLPVLIEGGELKVGGATVIETDIIASNGVVHLIDTVITDGSIDTPAP